MSEAEELAQRLEDEADFDIHHMTKNAMVHAAAELRRLSAELEQRNRDLHEAVQRFKEHALNEKDARMVLERELAEARNQALEDAAKCCDGLPAPESCSQVESSLWDVATIASGDAIRAMKKEQP